MKVKHSLHVRRARCSAAVLFLMFLAVVAVLWTQNAVAQQPALQKLTLLQIEGLVAHGVPDSTMAAQIQKRGLAFTPTSANLEELRAKGAGPLTLASIGTFFSGTTVTPNGRSNAISGIVTNGTTRAAAAGDSVMLLEVPGMRTVFYAITNAAGRYELSRPGDGPYLVEVVHQGVSYFTAAPPGGASGDIHVYDVAAKVQGIRIEADVIEAGTDDGQLKVYERYFIHNTSSPPTTQWSQKSFEIVLPTDAIVADVGALRPNGIPTSVKLNPDGPMGHYSFNFPIQPDDGGKDTLFQVSYSLPYAGGNASFEPQFTLPADSVVVILPKSMSFVAGVGFDFKPINQDPSVQTWLTKNVSPYAVLGFTISGTGSIPR